MREPPAGRRMASTGSRIALGVANAACYTEAPEDCRPLKITAERQPESQILLEIEVEPERVEQSMDQAFRRMSSRYRIPGFRPGKAPKKIVIRKYKKEVVDDVKRLTGADATIFQDIAGTPTRVSTTVMKLDGTGRGVNTVLIGPALAAYRRQRPGRRFHQEQQGPQTGGSREHHVDPSRDRH